MHHAMYDSLNIKVLLLFFFFDKKLFDFKNAIATG